MPQWVVAGMAEPKPPLDKPEAPPPREVARGVVVKLTQELRENIKARSSTHLGEMGALRKAFRDIDADKSGYIEIDEFCKALERFGLHTADRGLPGGRGGISSEVVQALFNSFDSDGSGSLDMAEFEEALLQPERQNNIDVAIRVKQRARAMVGAGG